MKRIFILIIIFVSLHSVTHAQLKPALQKDSTTRVDTSFMVKRMFFANPMSNFNYYNQMGIMCKAEYKMQKAIKIPLCFRVGSLEECKKRETIPENYSYK